MKASELRIGNYVTIDNNENWEEIKHIPMVVISIKYKEEGNYSISVDMAFEEDLFYNGFSQYERFIEPIQLTEELLLKIGFHKREIKTHCSYQITHPYIRIRKGLKRSGFPFYLDGRSRTKLMYSVHELQNLYFALTGFELEVK